ncbi:MAG: hypothetical protein CFH16_00735 [Alphaproteobacteria bacterium MarineAlpha5_Bin6]|nr:MAG: hypothetical protein CFH17_01086 [Alphaproteobacteria bacterium MarineAlpha5_Bin7]PPR53917.1 MAG: hypothetical protein CFH16_00735 [Alphaproteobacteria bacterium MarineAlpha5_Bin6]|tara:strand:- start:832 stop:1176 length:345 start_codon:yes stop_codon:yes gene_type:complete
MVRKELMFIKKILFFLFLLFSFSINAEISIDQWEDDTKTYKDLIDEGYEIKAYDTSTIKSDSGIMLILFVTVLQKNNQVYECQEYQTLDQSLQTLDLSFICRKLVQPYNIGVGT